MTSQFLNGLPVFLQEIHQEVSQNRQQVTNFPAILSGWNKYVSEAQKAIPQLIVEGGGHTLRLGPLSPGCAACKKGEWDCIFLTGRCNLNCSFCYSPSNSKQDEAQSAFGATQEQIRANYARSQIQGISFSGGEPFLDLKRLLDWTAWARQHFPNCYIWVYTNGSLAQPKGLDELARLGLDEIRFNVAATGYQHPRVMDNIQYAVSRFSTVTIEIPAIPAHGHQILESLPVWIGLGIKHLNLHELIYEPGTQSDQLAGERVEICLPDGHNTSIDPGSRELILEVMKQSIEYSPGVGVNHCSLVNKVHQVAARRTSLLPLTQGTYEKQSPAGLLESYVFFRGTEDYFRCHPDMVSSIGPQYRGYQCVRIARSAPLSSDDRGMWLVWDEQPQR